MHLLKRWKNITSEIGYLFSTIYDYIKLSFLLHMTEKAKFVNIFPRKFIGESYNTYILDSMRLLANRTEKAEHNSLLIHLLSLGRTEQSLATYL